jgi:hypothetical protein
MPREFTHWLVAGKVANELKNTIFANSLTKYKNILLLGANFHDIVFYTPRVFKKGEISRLPDILHGSEKEDTFDILKTVVDSINRTNNNDHLIAFLVGLISHIFTDSTFHPMVFYYAGHFSKKGWLSQSNQRHRKFEALMDYYLCRDMMGNPEYFLSNLLNNPKYPIKELFRESFSEYFIKDKKKFVKALYLGYRKFSVIQNLALNLGINKILSIIEPYLPFRLKDATTIRYDPDLLNYLEFISGEIKYKNPVNGDNCSSTLQSLLEKSVKKSVSFCMMIEKFIIEKKHLELSYVGPSLKAGLPSVSVKEMKYFYEKDVFN